MMESKVSKESKKVDCQGQKGPGTQHSPHFQEPKYIITAVNNLTDEREPISKPHSRWKTEELLTKAMRDNRKHRKHAAYSLYRMELYTGQQKLNFNQQ